MSALATSALSLSNSFTKVGAIAAFAALVGVALLALLVFAQAREIKRLREWAGRAPERAAEREQRIAADARRERPVAHTGPAARVIPRSTPLVSAPVSSAVSTAAAAATSVGSVSATPATHAGQPLVAQPGGEAVSRPQVAQQPPETDQQHGAQAQPGQPQTAEHEQAGEPAASPEVQPAVGAGSAAEPQSQHPVEDPRPAPERPAGHQPDPVPGGTGHQQDSGSDAVGHQPDFEPGTASRRPAGAQAGGQRAEGDENPGTPVPATVAGAAVGAARGQFPPSPPAQRSAPVASAAAAAPIASRAVGYSAPAGRRPPLAGERSDAASGRRSVELGRRNGQPEGAPTEGSPKYYRRERSPRRRLAFGVAGAVVLVVVAVLLLSALKGGSNQAGANHPPSSGTSAEGTANNPAETSVTVLNGTNVPGLAHRLASELQQGGYTLAAASNGVPSGSHSSTVVEYARGHRADARKVAKDLHVSRVQPLSSSVASLGGSAAVVVVAGSDKAPSGAEGAAGGGAGGETAAAGSTGAETGGAGAEAGGAGAGATGATGGEAGGGEPTAP